MNTPIILKQEERWKEKSTSIGIPRITFAIVFIVSVFIGANFFLEEQISIDNSAGVYSERINIQTIFRPDDF